MSEVSRSSAQSAVDTIRNETSPSANTAERVGAAMRNNVDSVMWNNKGLASARPGSSTIVGDVYFATDTGVTSRWDGSAWVEYTASSGELADDPPENVTKSTALTGTSGQAAREDHKHDVSTAAPAATGVATASGEGAATTLARSDHTHQSNTAPVNVTKATAAIGTSGQPARADHKHDITTAAAVELTDSTNAEGAATSLARSNHTHAHGNRGGGTLHAVATTGTAGFMSAADKTKIDGLSYTANQIPVVNPGGTAFGYVGVSMVAGQTVLQVTNTFPGFQLLDSNATAGARAWRTVTAASDTLEEQIMGDDGTTFGATYGRIAGRTGTTLSGMIRHFFIPLDMNASPVTNLTYATFDENASIPTPAANHGNIGVVAGIETGNPNYPSLVDDAGQAWRLIKSKDLVRTDYRNDDLDDSTTQTFLTLATVNNFAYKVNVFVTARDGANQTAQLEYEARYVHVNSALTKKTEQPSATNYDDHGGFDGALVLDVTGTSIRIRWTGPNEAHRLETRIEVHRLPCSAPT